MSLLQVVSLHFVGCHNKKGVDISVWTYPILGEPHYIGVSCNVFMCLIFASCLLLFLYDIIFITILACTLQQH